MNFQVALLFGMLSMAACGPSGPQNNLVDEYEGEYPDSDENEVYDYYDEYEEEYEDMQDGMDEENGEYVELPDWMDVDLDQLPIEKMSMLSSAKNLTQLMKLLELNESQQDKLKKGGPMEIIGRSGGSKGPEIAECKPELKAVRLETPPRISYLPACFRLQRCGGCCTSNLLSCQPTMTENIKVKVMEVKPSRRRRSTRRRRRGAEAKYVMVDQVSHLKCSCQCHIKEQDCDTSIQEYKKSECACVCKNRGKERECVSKNSHIWDRKSCSCRCKKIRECSTGEEFNHDTCRCIPTIGGRTFNSNGCDSFCGNGEPVECSCKDGWKGRRCNQAICASGCVNGKCVSPDTCECQEGWHGDQCQHPICASGCVNGNCVSPDTCECQEGWHGDQCQHRDELPVLQPRKDCRCIPITLCKPLLNLERNDETKSILVKATCDSTHRPPKVCCPSLLPSFCGQSAIYDERIYGGMEVKMGKYPWIALLGYKVPDSDNPDEVYYHCGGSVISDRYILTAAHCVTDIGTKILSSVLLGEWDKSTELDCDENGACLPAAQVYRPEKVIVHPDYDTRGTFSDDIALIKLDASVNITGRSFIRAVCLPESSMDIRQVLKIYKRNRGNLELSVAGWGVTERGTLSDKLLEVELPLVEDSFCNRTYNNRIVSGQICAGGRMGQDSCRGDSGGPLVLPGPTFNMPYLQVGVVSFGPQHCGMQNYPGVYTEVSMYREWIEENIDP